MVAVQNGSAVRHGEQTPVGSGIKSKALEVAQGGIETMYDITNLALGVSIDAMREVFDPKVANATLRGVSTAVRAVEVGNRVGHSKKVAGVTASDQQGEDESLKRREAELTAELERVREKRSA